MHHDNLRHECGNVLLCVTIIHLIIVEYHESVGLVFTLVLQEARA